MQGKASIKINFIMNMILTMSGFIFPLISFPYATRILGPEGIGKYSFALSLVSYFLLLSQLGIPYYGIREAARVRDDKILLSRTACQLLFINLLMNLLSYTLLFLAVFLIPKLREERLLYLILSPMLFLSAIGMEWLYQGLEKYSYITIRSIIFKFISLIFLFLFVRTKGDYPLYALTSLISSSASYALNFINAGKYIDFSVLRRRDEMFNGIRKHFRPVVTFFLMSCATTIYTNLDILMLGIMTDNTEVGFYSTGVRIKNILVSIITALGGVLLPRASYYVEKGEMENFKNLTKKSFGFILNISAAVTVYFMLFSGETILFLAGESFEGAVLPMLILMPTVILIGTTNVYGIQILLPLKREDIVLKSEITGALLDLIFNLLFIPYFLSSGAALGTLIAETGVLTVQARGIRKVFKSFSNGSEQSFSENGSEQSLSENEAKKTFTGVERLLKNIFGTVPGILFCLLIKAFKINLLLKLFLSGTVFFLFYLMYLFFMKDEFVFEIIDMIKRKRDPKKVI